MNKNKAISIEDKEKEIDQLLSEFKKQVKEVEKLKQKYKIKLRQLENDIIAFRKNRDIVLKQIKKSI